MLKPLSLIWLPFLIQFGYPSDTEPDAVSSLNITISRRYFNDTMFLKWDLPLTETNNVLYYDVRQERFSPEDICDNQSTIASLTVNRTFVKLHFNPSDMNILYVRAVADRPGRWSYLTYPNITDQEFYEKFGISKDILSKTEDERRNITCLYLEEREANRDRSGSNPSRPNLYIVISTVCVLLSLLIAAAVLLVLYARKKRHRRRRGHSCTDYTTEGTILTRIVDSGSSLPAAPIYGNLEPNVPQDEAIYLEVVDMPLVQNPVPLNQFQLKKERNRPLDDIHNDYMRLNNTKPSLSPDECRTAMDSKNMTKNQTMEILPPDRALPVLEGGKYINAVYVKSFRINNAFLVTQVPLPDTIEDFWQMIWDTMSKTVVTLGPVNIQGKEPIWPSKGYKEFGRVRIEVVGHEIDDNIKTVSLLMSNSKVSEITYTLRWFNMTSFQGIHSSTVDVNNMANLITKVERWQKTLDNKYAIVVQCKNGCTLSGVFCCCYTVYDRLVHEEKVDLFNAVRIIRKNRPQFIETSGQYAFCHQVTCLAVEKKLEALAIFKIV